MGFLMDGVQRLEINPPILSTLQLVKPTRSVWTNCNNLGDPMWQVVLLYFSRGLDLLKYPPESKKGETKNKQGKQVNLPNRPNKHQKRQT